MNACYREQEGNAFVSYNGGEYGKEEERGGTGPGGNEKQEIVTSTPQGDRPEGGADTVGPQRAGFIREGWKHISDDELSQIRAVSRERLDAAVESIRGGVLELRGEMLRRFDLADQRISASMRWSAGWIAWITHIGAVLLKPAASVNPSPPGKVWTCSESPSHLGNRSTNAG
jgi:hypothetical protein